MLTINTNLSSLITQSSMKQSTDKLNQAIERMTTGFKINHAGDNAANYSISTNMTTKMNAYLVAEDNVSMGLDMVTTISENIDLVNDHVRRIRDLAEQAANGTYGEDSIKAIQAEIDSRLAEISRLKSSAEFNGIKILESEQATPATFAMQRAGSGVTGSFIEEVDQLTEEEAIAQGYTIIKTADELQAMQNNPSGKYILMNDIDLEGYDWTPVGGTFAYSRFTGELNGNGFIIKNLTINKPTEDYVGLFGCTDNATIKNLGVENTNITAGGYSGILIGEAVGGNIENVYVTGIVKGICYIGGLAGDAYCYLTATNCYANIEIIGGSQIGGLLGRVSDAGGASLVNCYATGTVIGHDRVGGLVGFHDHDGYIENSYSSCEVSGNSNVGALLGYKGDYTVGTNSYFDKEKSGVTAGTGYGSEAGIQGVTTAELQALIDNGTLPKIFTPPPVTPTGSLSSITLQVGTNGDSNSQITFDLATTLAPLEITITDSDSARASLTILDNYLAQISDYQTNLGAVTNRLESALNEISIQYDNLASSRSTIRDADIAEVSSTYIQQQILQQASATLLATANQSPAIALQLI